ncbi:MAG: aldehyde dehydrogenase EutE [Bacillota bacterium]|jgi:acyl-CoA reductase-like NAD-dependent aldehyde dehydrogenase|nr:aldehyde dehydrogenase EutE [Bacillota bacterium]NLM07666.1 aldehyde dehydrogenase EutE [Clostridiales Family XIII bacterium]
MTISLTERDVAWIIEQVIKNVEQAAGTHHNGHVSPVKTASEAAIGKTESSTGARLFVSVAEAVSAAHKAQQEYTVNFKIEDRNNIIASVREAAQREAETIAQMIFEETGLGRKEDKVAKILLAALKTPGVEDLKTTAISGDYGLTIEEMAPFGVIGAITPVTNPAETVINNTISMLAAGNSVVFNVHPSSVKCCSYVVRLLDSAIRQGGGPANLITMIENPTIETLNEIASDPRVNLLVGTGGAGLVRALLRSGKKTIGAGAGNPPVVVDETADIEHAAKSIIEGAAFDNNILCIAEKEVFAVQAIADELIYHMLQNGAYMLGRQELAKVMDLTLTADEKSGAAFRSGKMEIEYHVKKEWIGKSAESILNAIGVKKDNIKILLCEVDFSHPYVQLEQMIPVLPIVRCTDVDEAITMAVRAEQGNRHTASIFSRDVVNMTRFAKAVNTTLFVKNAPTLAGVGYKGEGSTTFTIAGPTGEGVTSAKTFTRVRRCTLAEGGFRII